RRSRRTVPAAAVQHHRCSQVRHMLFHVAFDNSLAQMDRAREVILRIFALFAKINQSELLTPIELPFYVIDAYFMNPPRGIQDDLQKTRRMLVCHWFVRRTAYPLNRNSRTF